ncbi:MAG: hypothetical protein ACRD3D_14410, partial [Terriglobia bacterium]
MAELTQNIFVGNTFSASERSTRPVECGGSFWGDFFFFHGSGSQRAREWFHQYFEQPADGSQLLFRQHIEQRVGVLAFSC